MPKPKKVDLFKKIVNPKLAQAALNGTTRHGVFKAFVKLDQASARPAGLKDLMPYAAGLYSADIDCDQIEAVIANAHVVSVELREYFTH